MLHQDFEYLRHQHTILAPIVFVGIGLHTGRHVTMRILPAPADHGIRFTRRDLRDGENQFFARWDRVSSTELCTTLDNVFGHHIATVEHLLSALSGLGVDNAEIVLEGPEVPIVDGSAMPYVSALKNAGIQALDRGRDLMVIRRPVSIQHGDQWVELLPDNVPRISVSIDFQHQEIGHQSLSLCVSPVTYTREIAPARTFGFAEELWQLRRRGLARGGSIKNAILLEEGRVANIEGLRFSNEFVRHKTLDVIGDLSLAGLPIIGHYRGNRPGHRLNNELLRLLMNDAKSWQRVPAADLLDGKYTVSTRDDPDVNTASVADEAASEARHRWRDVSDRVFAWMSSQDTD